MWRDVTTVDPFAAAAAAALAEDPFYATVSRPYATHAATRADVLRRYFACSIEEGDAIGRVQRHAEPAAVAVWTLPAEASLEAAAHARKLAGLASCLGAEGLGLYTQIVRFMSAATAPWVDAAAWYLSILAVEPTAQNGGIGRLLLAPTLAEADRAGVACYLETFTPRSCVFYERLGFSTRVEIAEPTTGATYAVMVREREPPSR